MAFNHSITRRIVTTGGSRQATKELSADGEQRVDVAVNDQETDKQVEFDILIANLESIFILATVDMTIKTNSSSAPDETLNIKADQPYVWHTDCYFANLLATNITALYVTNSSGENGVLKIEAIHDVTP